MCVCVWTCVWERVFVCVWEGRRLWMCVVCLHDISVIDFCGSVQTFCVHEMWSAL